MSLSYGRRCVIQPLNLSISAGQSTAIVGPSGAGKTSLLRLLGGGLRPDAGAVTFGGVKLVDQRGAELSAQRSQVGFIYQDHQLVPSYRVLQNVLTGAVGKQGLLASLKSVLLPGRSSEAAVHALLERVGIGDKLFAWTHTLSGGERQRVAIARALYQQPSVLLADEPVASVDPARAEALIRLLIRVASEEGWGLVVSLHSPELVRAHFDRVIGLRDGAVVFDRPARAVTEEDFEALYALEGV